MERPDLGYASSVEQFTSAVLSGDEPVTVYTQNYVGGHVRALQTTYPTVYSTLGDAPFAAIARVFTLHYPAAHWDINLYGEGFADLLSAQTQGGKADDFDWVLLATIARVEYAITLAYYADDDTEDPAGQVPAGPARPNAAHPIVIGPADVGAVPASTSELQQSYPFADIALPLLLDCDVFVWRDGLRVRVENLPPSLDH
jgi:hypothetical protein